LTTARVRLSTAGNLAVDGLAADGEVEDYAVVIEPPAESEGDFSSPRTIFTHDLLSTNIIASADVDGDGDLDAISRFDYLVWHENDGTPEMGAWALHAVNLAIPNGWFGLVVPADLDGDGDVDLITTNGWFENDGTPASGDWALRSLEFSQTPSAIFVADLDDDGDLDIVTNYEQSDDDRVAWYENNGAQSFTEHAALLSSFRTSQPVDLDNDGDLDFLGVKHNYNDTQRTVVWYENDGALNLTQRAVEQPTFDSWSRAVKTADVDGDGDLDVILMKSGIYWYENDGTPAVGLWAQRTITGASYGATVADLDGDGDVDLVGTNSTAPLVWYENDGAVFTSHTIDATYANHTGSIDVGDVDGDGDLDILSKTSYGITLAWYENLSPDYSGDFNNDGYTDGFDFLQWQRQFGSPAVPPGAGADANDDGSVNREDLAIWELGFGPPPVAVPAMAASSAPPAPRLTDASATKPLDRRASWFVSIDMLRSPTPEHARAATVVDDSSDVQQHSTAARDAALSTLAPAVASTHTATRRLRSLAPNDETSLSALGEVDALFADWARSYRGLRR
jgi:hypothetical protein